MPVLLLLLKQKKWLRINLFLAHSEILNGSQKWVNTTRITVGGALAFALMHFGNYVVPKGEWRLH